MGKYKGPISAAPILVFLAGIGAGFLLWGSIRLPLSNPWEVVGPPSRDHFNPLDNCLSFAWVVLLPSVFWVFFRIFRPGAQEPAPGPEPSGNEEGEASAGKGWKAGLVLLALLCALNLPTYHASGRFDPFHEGESLGPALSALAGQVPYRDYFFFHGFFQDPGRSMLAFRLFGRSIGAERTLESILKCGVWVLWALLLAKRWGRRPGTAFALLLWTAFFSVPFLYDVLIGTFQDPGDPQSLARAFPRWEGTFAPFHWMILSARDFLTVAFLLAFLSLAGHFRPGPGRKGERGLFFSSFFFSLAPVLALAHSVDRGLYLCAGALVLSLTVHGCFFQDRRRGRVFAAGSFAGFGLGALVLGWVLDWNYGGFFKFLLLELPRYKLMTDTLPFPILDPRYALSVILLSFLVFRLVLAFPPGVGRERELRERIGLFLERDGFAAVLCLVAVLYFRNVLERPVLDHLAYSFPWIFLALAAALFGTERGIERPIGRRLLFAAGLLIAVLGAGRVVRFGLWERNFPYRETDGSFVPADRKPVLEFMKRTLGPDEPFFAFTNDPSWYYLLGRPCPTSYPCLWVAAPRYLQERVVAELEAKRIEWVLYRNGDWSSSIDDIPDEARFPVIAAYLRERYKPDRSIGDQQIWVRKE